MRQSEEMQLWPGTSLEPKEWPCFTFTPSCIVLPTSQTVSFPMFRCVPTDMEPGKWGPAKQAFLGRLKNGLRIDRSQHILERHMLSYKNCHQSLQSSLIWAHPGDFSSELKLEWNVEILGPQFYRLNKRANLHHLHSQNLVWRLAISLPNMTPHPAFFFFSYYTPTKLGLLQVNIKHYLDRRKTKICVSWALSSLLMPLVAYNTDI